MENWQRFSIFKVKDCLYAYLPHDVMFDSKYIMFGARPNAIKKIVVFRHFGNNFIFTYLLTYLFTYLLTYLFILPLWCIKAPKIMLDMMHLKKDHSGITLYKKLFLEIQDSYGDYISVYTDGSRAGSSVACATAIPSGTIISTIFIDASIFTSEIRATIDVGGEVGGG